MVCKRDARFYARCGYASHQGRPGTISEAFIAGLPIILYHRVSGQEEGMFLML